MATIIEERRETYPSETTRGYDKSYEKAAKAVTGGAIGEGLGGVATIVLTILGLARLFPLTMSAISGIIVGAAFMWEGGLVSTQYNRLMGQSGFTSRMQFGSGMAAQFLGGAAGCVLGILALLGIYPVTLVSVSAIIYGAVLAVGGFSTFGIDVNLPWKEGKDVSLGFSGASGMQVMVGFAAGILGLLALVGLAPMTLNLVSMLCVGSAILFSGTAVSARIFKSA